MAARKSCTHLTWAEAKGKVGGSSGAGGKKAKQLGKKAAHSDVLAQKIIAKRQQSSASGDDEGGIVTKAQQRRQERADAKASAAIAAAKEEERLNSLALVAPSESAKLRMEKLVQGLHEKPIQLQSSCIDDNNDPEEKRKVFECKQLQLDEIMALEAIFLDSNDFQMFQACSKDELQSYVETYQEDEDEIVLNSIVKHPSLAFTLSMTVDDNRESKSQEDEDLELVASVVLQIILPDLYPLYNMTPNIEIHDIMVTSKTADPIRPDKTLDSLVHVDMNELNSQLRQACAEILPDLCVYEVTNSWLSEHLFDFVELRTHAVL